MLIHTYDRSQRWILPVESGTLTSTISSDGYEVAQKPLCGFYLALFMLNPEPYISMLLRPGYPARMIWWDNQTTLGANLIDAGIARYSAIP